MTRPDVDALERAIEEGRRAPMHVLPPPTLWVPDRPFYRLALVSLIAFCSWVVGVGFGMSLASLLR